MHNPTTEPRSPAEIKRLTLSALEKALELFHQQTVVAHESNVYDAHLALVKVRIDEGVVYSFMITRSAVVSLHWFSKLVCHYHRVSYAPNATNE